MLLFFILAKLNYIATFIDRFNSQTQRLQLFHQNTERSGNTWFLNRFTFYDCFVSIHAALYIIRFNSQHLLQSICGSISFKRPYFHFTKSLTTKLCLTTKRLLRYQTVRASGTRVYFVFHQVMQLQYCHHAHGHWLIVWNTGFAISQSLLTKDRQWKASGGSNLLCHFHNSGFSNSAAVSMAFYPQTETGTNSGRVVTFTRARVYIFRVENRNGIITAVAKPFGSGSTSGIIHIIQVISIIFPSAQPFFQIESPYFIIILNGFRIIFLFLDPFPRSCCSFLPGLI